MKQDAALGEGGVGFGHALQRQPHRLDEEIIHRKLVRVRPIFRRARIEPLPCIEQRIDLAIDGQAEMGDRRRRHGQARSDGFPHIVERADFVAALLVKSENLIVGHRRRECAAWHKRAAILRYGRFHGGGLRSQGCCARTRGLVNVVLHNTSVRTRTANAGQVEARLLREPSSQRRREDAAVTVRLRGCGRLRSLCRLLLRRSGLGLLGLRLLLMLWRRLGGLRAIAFQGSGVLAFRQKHRNRRIDRHAFRPLRDHDFSDRALVDGFDFHRRLVGLDLCDCVARGNVIAFLLQPLRKLALLHGGRQRGHEDGSGHRLILEAGGDGSYASLASITIWGARLPSG